MGAGGVVDVKKLAGILVVAGVIVLSLAVGFYDWRAGAGLFGACLIAAGTWTLKE